MNFWQLLGNDVDKRYFPIAYAGNISRQTQSKISKLCKQFCKSIEIRLAFRTFKIGSMLSVKDATPSSLRSRVVYKFKCGCCGATYIGETIRHLSTRMNEHLVTAKSSHINIHLNANPLCKLNSNESCFEVIDSDSNECRLRVKEALLISREQPVLNRQLHHEFLTLPL